LDQKRQRTFVAPTILQTKDSELFVDSHISLQRSNFKIVNLLKFFFNKFAYQEELVSTDDKLFLNYLFDRFVAEQKLGLQENFSKNQNLMIRTAMICINRTSKLKEHLKLSVFKERNPLLMSSHAYFGEIFQNSDRIRKLSFRMKRRPTRTHYQKYVGVGYNDKGTSTVCSSDGSPSWQELSYSIQLEKLASTRRVPTQLEFERLTTKTVKVKTKTTEKEIKFHLRIQQISGSDSSQSVKIFWCRNYLEASLGFQTDLTEENLTLLISSLKTDTDLKDSFSSLKPFLCQIGSQEQVVFL
jgi:hypothetical protein